MSEPIVTKRCSKCKEIKGVSKFAPRCDRPSGLQSWCKQCQKEHNHKPEVAENIRNKSNARHRQPKHKKHRRQYQKSAKYKTWLEDYRERTRDGFNERQRRYNKQRTKNGKNRTRAKRYARENPEKVHCHWAVKYAVKSGKLKKAKEYKCFYCDKQAEQRHHWHGYDNIHRLDVIPLCSKCQKSVHRALVPYVPVSTVSGTSARIVQGNGASETMRMLLSKS